MNYYKFLVLFFIILFSLNVFSYDISKIDTKITVRENGILQISDTIYFTDVSLSEEIILYMVPVYDLKIKSNYKDLNYSHSFDSLKINVSDCCILDNSLSLEIIYLTDVFSYKNGSVWNIDYFPIFLDTTDSLYLNFLQNIEIVDLSIDFRYVGIENNKFVISINEPLQNLDVNYSINYNFKEENSISNNNLIIFLGIIILLIIFFYLIKSKFFKNNTKNLTLKEDLKNKTNFENKIIDTEDILLGLNENEQKIIKVIIEKNGILQKQVAKEVFLPKGTISRNLKKLEDKGYVSIKRYGVNKKVFLGDVFLKK